MFGVVRNPDGSFDVANETYLAKVGRVHQGVVIDVAGRRLFTLKEAKQLRNVLHCRALAEEAAGLAEPAIG